MEYQNIIWFLGGIVLGWIICWVRNLTKGDNPVDHDLTTPEIELLNQEAKPKKKRKKKRTSKVQVQSAQDIIDEVVKEDKAREESIALIPEEKSSI